LQRGSARRSRPAPPPAGPIRLTPSPRGSAHRRRVRESRRRRWPPRDRKSTRLNSSHSQISYAVFCLKKKKKHSKDQLRLTQHSRRLIPPTKPCSPRRRRALLPTPRHLSRVPDYPPARRSSYLCPHSS